jgi:ABC-type polysaccharide/polyol phosphate export permease
MTTGLGAPTVRERSGRSARSARLTHWFELLESFVVRDVRARYTHSVLGLYWAVLNPLLMAAVFTLVFSGVLQIDSGDTLYVLFLLAGLATWNLFATGLSSATGSLVAYASLLGRVRFQREALPVASVIARLVDFALALVVLLVLMLVLGHPWSLGMVWVFPVVAVEVIFTVALALPLAALHIFYRDIGQLLGVVLLLWMYITPVIFPAKAFPPSMQLLFWLNPMGVLVHSARDALLDGSPPDALALTATLAFSVALLGAGLLLFRRLQGRFAEIL